MLPLREQRAMARTALGRHCSKLLGKEDRIITCWRFGSSSLTSWHPTPSLFRLHLNSAVSIQSSPLLGDWQTNEKMPRQPDFFFFIPQRAWCFLQKDSLQASLGRMTSQTDDSDFEFRLQHWRSASRERDPLARDQDVRMAMWNSGKLTVMP